MQNNVLYERCTVIKLQTFMFIWVLCFEAYVQTYRLIRRQKVGDRRKLGQ